MKNKGDVSGKGHSAALSVVNVVVGWFLSLILWLLPAAFLALIALMPWVGSKFAGFLQASGLYFSFSTGPMMDGVIGVFALFLMLLAGIILLVGVAIASLFTLLMLVNTINAIRSGVNSYI